MIATPTLLLRPVLPVDAPALQAFVQALAPASRRDRFHGAVNGCSDAFARGLAHADGWRAIAWVACDDEGRIVGEARCYRDPDDPACAEFALAVADERRGSGLAAQLMDALSAAARRAGIERLEGEVLQSNGRMKRFLQRQGFEPMAAGEPGSLRWACTLVAPAAPADGWWNLLSLARAAAVRL